MGNWNIDIANNTTSDTRIVPPFVDEVGPEGTATHGIELEKNHLTGSVIHYSDDTLVSYKGEWIPRIKSGMGNLFRFSLLEADKAQPASISYTIPIPEDGTYQISLLYSPDGKNASNATIQVHHADGIDEKSWNMKKGDKYGFALEVGVYRFEKNKPAKLIISNAGADGIVVADSVAFVKGSLHK